MGKLTPYLFAVLIGAIVWIFFLFFEVDGQSISRREGDTTEAKQPGRLLSILFPSVAKKRAQDAAAEQQAGGAADTTTQQTSLRPTSPPATVSSQGLPPKAKDSIRIGSFHLNHFGAPGSNVPAAIDVLVKVVRDFDILALQGISPDGARAVRSLTRKAGSQFEFLMASPTEVAHQDAQFAFIYNKNTILADRYEGFYALGDPDNLLSRDPLVGSFLATQARDAQNAGFTFTLVNVDTDVNHVAEELRVLDNVMFEVRDDGRNEDDVILLGSFQAGDDQLGELGDVRGLVEVVRQQATTVDGLSMTENIVFQDATEVEYMSHGGVVDFPQAYGVSYEVGRPIADYKPIWADFSIYERDFRQAAQNSPQRR